MLAAKPQCNSRTGRLHTRLRPGEIADVAMPTMEMQP